MDQEPHQASEEPSSSVPAVVFAFAGAGLALAGMRLQHWAADMGACVCLLMAWYLTGSLAGSGPADHPMGKRSTRLLLVAFAVLTGGAGLWRLVRGGAL